MPLHQGLEGRVGLAGGADQESLDQLLILLNCGDNHGGKSLVRERGT